MRLPVFPRILLVGGLSFLIALPAYAQYEGGGDVTYEISGSVSQSFTVGLASIDAAYIDSLRSGQLSGLKGYAARLAGPNISVTGAYGSSDRGGRSAAAELTFGPQVSPYVRRGDVWVGVRVPVQFALGYTYIRPDSLIADDDSSPFHVGHAGLGLGLGLDASTATGSSVAREVSGLISFVLVPGVLTEFAGEPFETLYAQRSSEFDFELRASSLGGSGIGLAVGYTLLTTRVSTTHVGEFGDVLDSILADGFERRRRVGMFRVGLAF